MSEATDFGNQNAPNSVIQVITQLHRDLKADLERNFASSVRRMNEQHQQCQQAASDNIKKTVLKAMDEWFAEDQKRLPSRQEDSPVESQALKSEVRLEPDDSNHRAQVEQLTRKLKRADSELRSLKQQIKETESRADQLRNIVMSSDGIPILDSEIQKLFSDVRKGVQMVASRLYSKSGPFHNAITKDNRAFFEDMKTLSPECQRDAIHNDLFLFIRAQFFPNNIRECNLGNHDPELQKQLATTERALTQAVTGSYPDGMAPPLVAQNSLKLTSISSGSRQKVLSDWSRATFKCIDLLTDESDGPASYAAHLEEFFRPAETDSIQEKEKGRRKLRKLCEEAHKLGNLMRRVTDTFEVVTVNEGLPLTDCQNGVEELRCNGRGNSSGFKVVDSCLFGGLMKISNDYPTKPILLERAVVSTRFASST
ncbi:hypothetical protein FGADI_11164 [Fusarium gaditjirri]|uniref:Uncharacterized protein n=1 Tax=Fusarium gaditjirri TaxID=282569 RepID=A0A8H4SVV4_9HYPO|nr:hypothetical protein FGADI_11164 [Fusarium gaditjirri]